MIENIDEQIAKIHQEYSNAQSALAFQEGIFHTWWEKDIKWTNQMLDRGLAGVIPHLLGVGEPKWPRNEAAIEQARERENELNKQLALLIKQRSGVFPLARVIYQKYTGCFTGMYYVPILGRKPEDAFLMGFTVQDLDAHQIPGREAKVKKTGERLTLALPKGYSVGIANLSYAGRPKDLSFFDMFDPFHPENPKGGNSFKLTSWTPEGLCIDPVSLGQKAKEFIDLAVLVR